MTFSEELFDKYLKRRGIKFDIELGVLVHPDRFLRLEKGFVICEIKQLESKKRPVNYVVSVGNPYKRLRSAIKKKVRQGKEAKDADTPYVIVLFNYNSPQMMENSIIEAAMYGDISIVIDIPNDIKKRGRVRGNFFSANGSLRYARDHKESGQPIKKRVSAIAVLEIINPTEEVLSKEYDKASVGIDTQDIDKQLNLLDEISQKLKAEGKYDANLRVERLRVFHNFYATNPLGFDVFNGEHDEQYYIDSTTGQSKKY